MSASNGQSSQNNTRLGSFESPNIDSQVNTLVPRNRSFNDMGTLTEAKVLVIYTGGTIGMTRNSNNGMCCSR